MYSRLTIPGLLLTHRSQKAEPLQRSISKPSGKIVVLENTAQKDKALALLTQDGTPFDPKSPEARAVLRKIDFRIMPIVLVVYMLMLVDKNSISYAKIMGIQSETGLSASQYSWLGSIV